MKKLSDPELTILKTCAVRNNLTDKDINFIEARVNGNLRKNKLNCQGDLIPYFKRVHDNELLYHTHKDRGFIFGQGSYKYRCKNCGLITYSFSLLSEDVRVQS